MGAQWLAFAWWCTSLPYNIVYMSFHQIIGWDIVGLSYNLVPYFLNPNKTLDP
jgi:hypothetical protein